MDAILNSLRAEKAGEGPKLHSEAGLVPLGLKVLKHEMVQWFISSFRRFTAGTCCQLMSQSNRQGCFQG